MIELKSIFEWCFKIAKIRLRKKLTEGGEKISVKTYRNTLAALYENAHNESPVPTGIMIADVTDQGWSPEETFILFSRLFLLGALTGHNKRGGYIPSPAFKASLKTLWKKEQSKMADEAEKT